MKISNYVPSFAEHAGIQDEDADAYLERITTVPCGTDNVLANEKTGRTSAKSLAGAGQLIGSYFVNQTNKANKLAAFAKRFPSDVELIGYDEEVNERFKAFTSYEKSNETSEIIRWMNTGMHVPNELRDRVAKNVAQVGGFSGYPTDAIKEKFCAFAFNYWFSKNSDLQERILAGVDAD